MPGQQGQMHGIPPGQGQNNNGNMPGTPGQYSGSNGEMFYAQGQGNNVNFNNDNNNNDFFTSDGLFMKLNSLYIIIAVFALINL